VTDAVRAAQAGDPVAFRALYEAHVGRVYALCLRLAGDHVLAEELTQDVFVRAWHQLASYRGESAFSTWLHRVAVNEVMGRFRIRMQDPAGAAAMKRQRISTCSTR